MMTAQAPSERCIQAMSHSYGQFNTISDDESKTWIPPSQPGTGGHHGRRLWTDAFGVLNLTSLFLETGKKRYLHLAERLVETVHEVLGRTRDGSHRLPGATEKRPLLGGLRSGRPKEEDDGQVHRELTLWMFALDRLGRVSNDERWTAFAIELGEATHPRFTIHKLSGGMRLVGKVSGDLESVVDVERGVFDAVMGWAVFRVVQESAGDGVVLGREVEDYERIMGSSSKGAGGEEGVGEMKWLGMALWVSSLWEEEAWSEEMRRKGLERVARVFEEVQQTIEQPDVESRAVKELGACLGVRCWVSCEDDELMSASARVVRLWEQRLENGEIEEDEARGVVSVLVGAAVLSRAFRRNNGSGAKKQ